MEEGNNSQSKQESTSASNQDFIQNMKKQRRKSQGFGTNDIINSDEEAVDKDDYIKQKMQKQRRKSQGYCSGSNSSLEEIVVE